MSNKMTAVVGGAIGILFLLLASGTIKYVVSQGYATEVTGYSYTRETYISGCRYWARQEPESKDFSDAFINNYCGCVYDDGVALYGKEGFTKVDQELSTTGVVTAEVNELINTCVTKTLNSGAM